MFLGFVHLCADVRRQLTEIFWAVSIFLVGCELGRLLIINVVYTQLLRKSYTLVRDLGKFVSNGLIMHGATM